MFERYTEKARRVIFLARYEASTFGSPCIETEHFLLGLLREDKALASHLRLGTFETLREKIATHTVVREKIATSVDLPLSNECKRVLAYAAEEAERLGHKHIGSEHLLLGLLREKKCLASELLKEIGAKLEPMREAIAKYTRVAEQPWDRGTTRTSQFFRDLVQAASNGELEPIDGREQEVDALVETLCTYRRSNALIVGEPGSGRTSIVAALAQRIASASAPQPIAERPIFARAKIINGDAALTPQLASAIAELPENVILFLGDLCARTALMLGGAQFVAITTPTEYRELGASSSWLIRRFRPIYVRPFDIPETARVLQAHRARLERFHEVNYSDEALALAANSFARYLPDRALPGKALELLDAAGTHVQLRQSDVPEEVREAKKRLIFVIHRMDAAIANHEFEKARFYTEEEKKERETLRDLREKHHLEGEQSGVVGPETIEEVIARWSKYPFQP